MSCQQLLLVVMLVVLLESGVAVLGGEGGEAIQHSLQHLARQLGHTERQRVVEQVSAGRAACPRVPHQKQQHLQ